MVFQLQIQIITSDLICRNNFRGGKHHSSRNPAVNTQKYTELSIEMANGDQ